MGKGKALGETLEGIANTVRRSADEAAPVVDDVAGATARAADDVVQKTGDEAAAALTGDAGASSADILAAARAGVDDIMARRQANGLSTTPPPPADDVVATTLARRAENGLDAPKSPSSMGPDEAIVSRLDDVAAGRVPSTAQTEAAGAAARAERVAQGQAASAEALGQTRLARNADDYAAAQQEAAAATAKAAEEAAARQLLENTAASSQETAEAVRVLAAKVDEIATPPQAQAGAAPVEVAAQMPPVSPVNIVINNGGDAAGAGARVANEGAEAATRGATTTPPTAAAPQQYAQRSYFNPRRYIQGADIKSQPIAPSGNPAVAGRVPNAADNSSLASQLRTPVTAAVVAGGAYIATGVGTGIIASSTYTEDPNAGGFFNVMDQNFAPALYGDWWKLDLPQYGFDIPLVPYDWVRDNNPGATDRLTSYVESVGEKNVGPSRLARYTDIQSDAAAAAQQRAAEEGQSAAAETQSLEAERAAQAARVRQTPVGVGEPSISVSAIRLNAPGSFANIVTATPLDGDFYDRLGSIAERAAGTDGALSQSEAARLFKGNGTQNTAALGTLFNQYGVPPMGQGREEVYTQVFGLDSIGVSLNK